MIKVKNEDFFSSNEAGIIAILSFILGVIVGVVR
jgi:hypothetical protein